MSSPFKTKEFEKLQAVWYKKLSKKGFKDIERTDRVGKEENRLKTDATENIAHLYTIERFTAREDYYRAAGHFLYDYKFKTPKERYIWELHATGKSIREIVTILKSRRQKAYKDLVHAVIKRLTEEMKKYVREG